MDRQLGLVQGFRLLGVGEPRRQRRIVLGRQGRGVDEAAVAVGGSDRQRGRVAVVRQMRAHHREARPATVGDVIGQPLPDRAGLQRSPAHVESLVDLGFDGGQRVEQPVPQHPELQLVEQLVDLVAVPRLHPQRVRRLRQRHVANQVGELAVEHHAGQIRAQRVTDLAAHRVDVVDQRLQRAVLDDPFRRRLLAHARDAGQVVARVAAQGGEVGVLLRGQAVFLDHGRRGEAGQLADAFARIEHRHVVGDQLQRIAVTGDHQHPVALVFGLRRQRGDQVVGFEARFGEHRNAQRRKDFLGDVDLTAELVRRGRPVGLVFRVTLGAEGLPRHIERRGHMGGRFVAQQVDQHRGEPVDRVGGQPALGLEILGRQRVEGPVRQRIAVQQHQRRLVVSGLAGFGLLACGPRWAHGLNSRHTS